MMTKLLPLVMDLISLTDSVTLSQKYSGAILPVTMNGFVFVAIDEIFMQK
jgi:hypothetical protein